MHSTDHHLLLLPQILFSTIAIIAVILYPLAVVYSNRKSHLKHWPWFRTFFWMLGTLSAISALAGPLAQASHHDFRWHMVGHLLLGMLSPLLIALSAPMTLLLRTLRQQHAKKVSKFLKSGISSFYIHPLTAASLNIGGLWVLYTTDLYEAMHSSILMFVVIHIHIFFAGYLFTVSLLYIDPVPHRYSYLYRTVVFIIALAAHGILSKYIYAHPSLGVSEIEAKSGAMMMYYGGDVIDLIIIWLLFQKWYTSVKSHSRKPALTS